MIIDTLATVSHSVKDRYAQNYIPNIQFTASVRTLMSINARHSNIYSSKHEYIDLITRNIDNVQVRYYVSSHDLIKTYIHYEHTIIVQNRSA